MKNALYTLLISAFIASFFSGCSDSKSTASPEDLIYFAKLDSTLQHVDVYKKNTESRLKELKANLKQSQSIEATYFYNKLIADIYIFFEPDSATIYLNRSLALAQLKNNQEWLAETYLTKCKVYSSSGLLEQCRAVLDQVKALPSLNRELKQNYYMEEINYWSNRAIFMNTPNPDPHAIEAANSILTIETDTHSPYWIWAKIWSESDPKKQPEIAKELKQFMDHFSVDEPLFCMLADFSSYMFYTQGNMADAIKYSSVSLCSEIKQNNRNLVMLSAIGHYALLEGELTYASHFFNAALAAQRDYPDRIHTNTDLASEIMYFHEKLDSQLQKDNQQKRIQLSFLIAFGALALILLIYVFIQLRKKNQMHLELTQTLQKLNDNQKELKEVCVTLQRKEKELNVANDQLTESNFLKEEYIGQLFGICTEVLNKAGKQKLAIYRKLKASQFDEALKLSETKESKENEDLHELWNHFDNVFLGLFPDFISQFNSLLRPEEQIVLRKGEKMNTELRIYAIVRLGINNSVKIGKILGISTQTVYNTRVKMRSRATESEKEFALRVRELKGINPILEDYIEDDKNT